MEKKKKKSFRFLGWKLKEIIQLGTVLGAMFWSWQRIDARFEGVETRLDHVESRLGAVYSRLDNIEVDVRQTSDLLNSYLTWRFLYLHDPSRKAIEPRYDPNKKTLEFFDRKAPGK